MLQPSSQNLICLQLQVLSSTISSLLRLKSIGPQTNKLKSLSNHKKKPSRRPSAHFNKETLMYPRNYSIQVQTLYYRYRLFSLVPIHKFSHLCICSLHLKPDPQILNKCKHVIEFTLQQATKLMCVSVRFTHSASSQVS